MSRPSSPAGLSAPGHEGQDPPHPHHLAEQLPPINFEPASSEHTVAESAGEPMGAASEKGGATSDGGIEADAAGATAGDAEKGVASGPAVSDFPDGGFRAWSVVAGAWCISFTSWGYTNAFGVFQTYYQDNQLRDYTSSDISWIGSLQLAMVLACAILAGKAFDAGYIKYLLSAAVLFYTAGMFGFASATKYWEIFLGQGIACGLAAGIAFIPAASSVSHWFRRRRATALGVLATGSSIGGIVYPVMINHLFPKIGFVWTVRAVAFLTVGLVIIATLTINSRLPPRKVERIFDFRPLREKGFLLVTIGEAIIMWGLYTPYFFIQDYALKYGVSSNLALYSLSILNASSVFGRIIPNWLADTYGPLTILTPQCFLSGILIFLFIPMCKNTAGLVVFTILFGFSSGAYVSMMPATVASLTKNMNELGHRTATMFLIVSVFALTGTPISGALVHRDPTYVGAFCFAGACVIVGSCLNLWAWFVVSKQKGTRWV